MKNTAIPSQAQGQAMTWPLESCPTCGATELHPVHTIEGTNLLCPLCMSCWHEEIGSVTPVEKASCPGCQYELICREHGQSH